MGENVEKSLRRIRTDKRSTFGLVEVGAHEVLGLAQQPQC